MGNLISFLPSEEFLHIHVVRLPASKGMRKGHNKKKKLEKANDEEREKRRDEEWCSTWKFWRAYATIHVHCTEHFTFTSPAFLFYQVRYNITLSEVRDLFLG